MRREESAISTFISTSQMRAADKRKRRERLVSSSASSAERLLPPDLASLSRGRIISQYHVIKKQLAILDKSLLYPNEAARQIRRQVLEAQLRLIGIENYQHASREGEELAGGFDSSKWVTYALQHGSYDVLERRGPLHILDVGSITHRFPEELQLHSMKKTIPLRVTSIDLNPEDSEAGRRVIRADFFDFARQEIAKGGSQYDVVCLSLCVNFEGSANRRGLMIHLASNLLLRDGLLFLVLPRACVENSRYLNEERFHGILNAVGLKEITTSYSSKLMKSISSRAEGDGYKNLEACRRFARKEALRGGRSRNNFAIRLDSSLLKEDQGHDAVAKFSQTDGSELAALRGSGKKKRRTANKTAPGIEKIATTSNQRKKARRARKKLARLSERQGSSENASQ